MTKQLLIQYNDLLKEKEKLEKRINRLEKQSEMVSDVVQNGYKRHAVIYGHDLIRAKKLKELYTTLKIREAMIIVQQTEIEKFINEIEDSKTRQIFEYRYIDNMNWYQIQINMGYEHEDTARKIHDRFIKKILKNF